VHLPVVLSQVPGPVWQPVAAGQALGAYCTAKWVELCCFYLDFVSGVEHNENYLMQTKHAYTTFATIKL
jgi:hypothetical protein